MKSLVIFRNVFVAAALMAAATACQSDDAAERVSEQREALREERQDLTEEVRAQREAIAEGQRDDGIAGLPDNAADRVASARVAEDREQAREEVADEARDVHEQAIELAQAQAAFEAERHQRVLELRALHGVIASQPMLINAVAGVTPLTDRAQADLNEKMQIFQMRIDEAGNLIEALQGVGPENWEARRDEAAEIQERLEDARENAWEALTDGDRIEAS